LTVSASVPIALEQADELSGADLGKLEALVAFDGGSHYGMVRMDHKGIRASARDTHIYMCVCGSAVNSGGG
jgi:hypothetical protein